MIVASVGLVVPDAASLNAAAEEEATATAGLCTPAVSSVGAATERFFAGLVFGPGDLLGMRSDLI